MNDRAVTSTEVEAALNWHEALNDGDIERLVALSDPEIEVGGPRGSGRGAQLLREWMDRANIRLEPRRVFYGTETVVVEQEAEWRDTGTGETFGKQTVASVFAVRDGLVTSVVRYDDLADALGMAGFDESDEVERS